MASVNLQSDRHEDKSMKIKRHNALNKELSRGKTGLKPSESLKPFGRRMFKAIVENNEQLNDSDNATLNILCHEYDLYNDCLNYLNKHGLVDKKGRASTYYKVLKQTVDELCKISNSLNLTPKTRIASEVNNQDKESTDPLVKAVEDGDNA